MISQRLKVKIFMQESFHFRDMVFFCNNAREFMEADKRNVIALHCKGGKGRTGAMICVWLVHCGIFEDAKV